MPHNKENDVTSGSQIKASQTAELASAIAQQGRNTRYILITECLQNDFFLNSAKRLCIPDHYAQRMLVGYDASHEPENQPPLRNYDRNQVRKGPLNTLFTALADRQSLLHVVHIRDWHEPSEQYDRERTKYGPHCVAGDWGSEFIDDVKLMPDNYRKFGNCIRTGNVVYYDVRSNSIQDFLPPSAANEGRAGLCLESLLADLFELSDHELADKYRQNPNQGSSAPSKTASPGSVSVNGQPSAVYVAVIGVYTDIKVRTLVGALRSRYDMAGLAVSDCFTAAGSLEVHLGALAQMKEYLGVEIVGGIRDLVAYLGASDTSLRNTYFDLGTPFRQLESHSVDRQNVIAYQDDRLRSYVQLTTRSIRTADLWTRFANAALIALGLISITCALALSLWEYGHGQENFKLPGVLGALGVAQVVALFVTKPMNSLVRNATTLAAFRMALETHSLKLALSRFHLTTPRVLREFLLQGDAAHNDLARAKAQIEVLDCSLKSIDAIAASDAKMLEQLGIGELSGASGSSPSSSQEESKSRIATAAE